MDFAQPWSSPGRSLQLTSTLPSVFSIAVPVPNSPYYISSSHVRSKHSPPPPPQTQPLLDSRLQYSPPNIHVLTIIFSTSRLTNSRTTSRVPYGLISCLSYAPHTPPTNHRLSTDSPRHCQNPRYARKLGPARARSPQSSRLHGLPRFFLQPSPATREPVASAHRFPRRQTPCWPL